MVSKHRLMFKSLGEQEMKILIENSSYHLQNMGDLAMIKVGIDRLKRLFPTSEIKVFTTSEDKLRSYLNEVNPFSPNGRDYWSMPLVNKFYNSSNSLIQRNWSKIEDDFSFTFPQFSSSLVKIKLRSFPSQLSETKAFLKTIHDTDLIVATGGGYITDSFIDYTHPKLKTLALAVSLGKPTVMLGQGIGPLEKKAAYEKAKAVLPKVDLIALREGKIGPSILTKMGVKPEKVIVTGDDAIELAFCARPVELGTAIGINVRFANYSRLNREDIDLLRKTLQTFAKSKSILMLPIPIEHFSDKVNTYSDSYSIRELLKGFDDFSDGGHSLDTPSKVIEQIGRCRLVVTGSYHAGVFALSQGIPVVGLAKSQYYVDKFEGLSNQFPEGCKSVLLSKEGFESDLQAALENLWKEAEHLRSKLLEAAKQQIDAGHLAYKRIYDLVTQ